MKLVLKLYNTLIKLNPIQLSYQLKNRFFKSKYQNKKSKIDNISFFNYFSILKENLLDNLQFSFLNLEHKFVDWNFKDYGMLWAYNLNYMDWLNQTGMSYEEGEKWINRFIEELPNNKIGLDPYPIALRTINWIKFISRYQSLLSQDILKKWNDSLYSQLYHLNKTLEYHLLGNHLLEDAYALYIGASYFNDEKLLNKASKLLKKQLKEQILPDGAHFEQSPMYHSIMLDRLLDCININRNDELISYARYMLGHLQSLVWKDGSIPLLNDSAYKIAPSSKELFEYANRLDIDWQPIRLVDSGYRKFFNGRIETIIDIGNITASYQPGHTHADTFNFELRVDGKPFIIDTGISTYEKNARRQYERSTKAHNTVTPQDEKDSSEVWGGFRVGKRAKVKIFEDSSHKVRASHNGYGKRLTHERSFEINDNEFIVTDNFPGEGIAWLHFSPDVDLTIEDNIIKTSLINIKFTGANSIQIIDEFASTEYNILEKIKVAKIYFSNSLQTVFSF